MKTIERLKRFVWDQKAKYYFHIKEIKKNLSFPRRIFLELTNDCQMTCANCPREMMKRRIGYMDFSTVTKVIDEGAAFGPIIYHLYKDGEPLLHPELFRVLRYIREANQENIIYISTNGLLITEEKIDQFFKYDVNVVRFVCHAATKETYNKITKGRGDFDLLQQNILLLIDKKKRSGRSLPEVRLQIQESPQAIHEVGSFLDKWRKLDTNPRSKRYITWNPSRIQGSNRYPCKDLIDKASVMWDGRVTVCSLDVNGKVVIGNLRRQKLSDIWNGELITNYRNAHLANCYKDLSICEECNEWLLIPNLYWKNWMMPWKKEKWI